jgi:hypothetical protein
MKKYNKLIERPIPDHLIDDKEWISRNEKRNELIRFFNERFEKSDIPPYAEKLEKGHNYNGGGDGNFEILFINGDFYYICYQGSIDICDYKDLPENYHS